MVPIISHRGGAFLWPENSLTAFRESAALPLEMVECDVHLSRDGVPVIHHDAVLERTSEGKGPVSALTAAELASLRLRGARGDRIPTLAELAALVAATPVRLQVEVKSGPSGEPPPTLLGATLAVLDSVGLRARSGIIAFHAPTAAAAQAAGGLDHVAWLFDGTMLRALGAEGIVGVARAHGLRMVETNMPSLDAALLATLRGAGLRVAAWGANHAPEIGRALALGIDAMATDDPVLALRLRG
ncbi:glycerophosphodiester phosphodiesterase [Roseomonas sp. OT10]|uniref:glycerophosphodiester phosphodiesterase n=1 Tax=Roseomonas cutis TaxID=2897332 RepID=UPI001E4C16FB|nr:glycerophosphodiester phosphodiesterase family protein [Roseomonas sp. OT10]UFN51103.1 glycerophosphodiester phosphodiesterase [Roseomonas sp. OT10]